MRPPRSMLPNLLTLINLFLGFIAVLLVIDGRFVMASWLIITAGVIDALDGKLARFMNTQSEFGMEFDSLADITSFGIAPSVLVYMVYFKELSGVGMLLAFFPMLFCAVRLARYNVTYSLPEDHIEFSGLPTPVQAITLVSFVIMNFSAWGHLRFGLYLTPLVILTSLLMISHIPFDAFPRLSFRGTKNNRIRLILLIVGLMLILYEPSIMFFPVVISFIIAGGIKGLIQLRIRANILDEIPDVEEVKDEGLVG